MEKNLCPERHTNYKKGIITYPVEEVEKVELGRAASEPYPRHLSHHDPLELELADVEVDPFFGLRMLDASPEAAWLSIFRA